MITFGYAGAAIFNDGSIRGGLIVFNTVVGNGPNAPKMKKWRIGSCFKKYGIVGSHRGIIAGTGYLNRNIG